MYSRTYPIRFSHLALLYILLLSAHSVLAQYEAVPLDDGLLKFNDEGKWGIATAKGRILQYPIYDQIGWSDDVKSKNLYHPPFKSKVGYRKGENWGLMSSRGKELDTKGFDSLKHFELALAPAAYNGRWGLIDHKGRTAVDFIYKTIRFRPDLNLYVAQDSGNSIILLGEKGKRTFTDTDYSYISPSKNGRLVGKRNNGRFRLVDTVFNILHEGYYDSMEVVTSGAAKIWLKGRIGLLANTGKEVLPLTHSRISVTDDGAFFAETFPGFFPVLEDGALGSAIYYSDVYPVSADRYVFIDKGKHGLINEVGSKLTPAKFDSIISLGSIYAVQKDELLGLIDNKGRQILPITYESLKLDSASGFVVAKRFDGHLLYTIDGSPVSRLAYDNIWSLNNGLLALRNESGRVMIMRKSGRRVPFQQYDTAMPAPHGYAFVMSSGLQGLLDSTGNELLSPVFEKLTVIGPKLATFTEGEVVGVINLETLSPISGPLEEATTLGPGVMFRSKGKKGLIDVQGNKITDAIYDSINYDSKGRFFAAWAGNKLTIVDEGGELLYGPKAEFTKVYHWSEGRMRVLSDVMYGYVDRQGRLRITDQYEMARDFNEGRAAVMLRGKWGYINNIETIRVQPHYDSLSDLQNGLAIVKKGNLYGLIGPDGDIPLSIEHQSILIDPSGYFIVKKNGRYGLANPIGSVVIPYNYDDITLLSPSLVKLRQGNKFGVANVQGQHLQAVEYDEVISGNNGLLLKSGVERHVAGNLEK